MSDNNVKNMDNQQLDMFREIGNIGAGNAVTALAHLLNREINMSVPDARVVEFNEIVNILDGPETPVAGMLVDMSGDLNGYILLVLALDNAYEMVSLALSEDRPTPENIGPEHFDEMDYSVLTEIANILVGSYLSSIATLSGLNTNQNVPQIAMDMLGAIISIAAIEYGQIGDSVLLLQTKFSDIDKEMAGHFFLIPDYESYKLLMKSLGMES